ncbi:MAG: hypothetical protein ACTSR2_04300 [Candidatus Hodarchaeales archaeon]
MIIEFITFILVLIWGFQHSLFASKRVKELFGVYPLEKGYRFVYIMISATSLMIMELIIGMYLYPRGVIIQPIIPETEVLIRNVFNIIAILGVVIAVGAFVQADPLVFFGIRDERKITAKVGLFYRFSRHPIYLGVLLVMLNSIIKVQNSVLLTEYLTLGFYLIIGAKLEENRLKDTLAGYGKMLSRGFLFPYKKRHFLEILGRSQTNS